MEQEQEDVQTLENLISAFANKFNNVSSRENPLSDREGRLDVEKSEGVSFFITQAQKSRLRELGIEDDRIRNMKPEEAHRFLGIAS